MIALIANGRLGKGKVSLGPDHLGMICCLLIWLVSPSFSAATSVQVEFRHLSRAVPSDSANSGTGFGVLPANGASCVAFTTLATDLVAGVMDQNEAGDAFLLDRTTGGITLISRSASGEAKSANGSTSALAASESCDWILLVSDAGDLAPGIAGGADGSNAYLFQRKTGAITLLSRHALDPNRAVGGTPVAITPDGEWILLKSYATTLVAGVLDANSDSDVFLMRRSTGEVTLVSHAPDSLETAANGASVPKAMSDDGAWVLFESTATNLAPGANDVNGSESDVFLYERATGAITLVSDSATLSGATANGRSTAQAMSSDGAWVLFGSRATDLVEGVVDGNLSANDVFLFNRMSGTTRLVSRSGTNAMATSNNVSMPNAMSADGRWVVFQSRGSDLVTGVMDFNERYDVFLFDSFTDETKLVSRSADSGLATSDGSSANGTISSNGEWVAFESWSSNLVPGLLDENGAIDVFLFNRLNDEIVVASQRFGPEMKTGESGARLRSLSRDAEGVLISSGSTDLVGGVSDTNGTTDLFLRDVASSSSHLVSRALPGVDSTSEWGSSGALVSEDGRWVVFESGSRNLRGGNADENFYTDVFLYERDTGATVLLTPSGVVLGASGNGSSTVRAISPDGEWILIQSEATDLLAGIVDANGSARDIFMYHRSTGLLSLISHSVNSPQVTASGDSIAVAVSPDGEWILYQSTATDLVAGQVHFPFSDEVYLYQRSTKQNTLVSHAWGAPLTGGNMSSAPVAMTSDAEWILFSSTSPDLVGPGDDSNNLGDVFLFQRSTGIRRLVSHARESFRVTGDRSSFAVGMSQDGKWVLFNSSSTNLVSGLSDLNETGDAFLFETETGTISLISRSESSAAQTADASSLADAISRDGEWIYLTSLATDLVPGRVDRNGAQDVYRFRRSTGVLSQVSLSAIDPSNSANGHSQVAGVTPDGGRLLMKSWATDLVEGQVDDNEQSDLFLVDRFSGQIDVLSRSLDSATQSANGYSESPSMSADGGWVAFQSRATDIVAGVDDINLGVDAILARVVHDGFRDGFEGR